MRMVAELLHDDGKHHRRVLKLAAQLVQHDNEEKTWLEFRFKLENYLTLVGRYDEPSDGNGRISGDHPNVESHNVHFAGDTH